MYNVYVCNYIYMQFALRSCFQTNLEVGECRYQTVVAINSTYTVCVYTYIYIYEFLNLVFV
jgi:hypothetical protein